MIQAICFFTTLEPTGSCHHLLLHGCPFWGPTLLPMIQEGPSILRRELWLSIITYTHPYFTTQWQHCHPYSRLITQWVLSYDEEFLIGSGWPLCSNLIWELSMISFFILQCFENMLKSLLLINSSDIVFLFLSDKQGNWNKANLLTLHVLVMLCPFL